MSTTAPPFSGAVSTVADISVPLLGDIARKVESITPDTPVLEVLSRFHGRENLLALPLLDPDGNYLGMISRRAFLSFMSRAYAREVYTRKPVADIIRVMPELGSAPVQPASGDRIDQVLVEYLSSDPGMYYDALPVVRGKSIIGVAHVADMMLSLSESQEKLLEAVQSLSDRLKQEVSLAAQLQRQLLPPSEISLPGVRGLATLVTSSEVGGDYYDRYTVGGRYAVLMIGDVSGHGVAAGTLVSAVKGGVNLLASENERDPERILTRLNGTLLNTAQQTLYMTMFVACLDNLSGQLWYANAGHQFPYLYRRAGRVLEMLEVGGLPLGKSAHAQYRKLTTEMDLGDRLYLYTDGLLEQPSPVGEEFGYERLEHWLQAEGDGEIEALRDRLFDELTQHTGSTFFEDDVTFFGIEFHERSLPMSDYSGEAPSFGEIGLVHFLDSWYRNNQDSISPYVARQTLVLLADDRFGDLLPRLAHDGIRRVLPRNQPLVRRLGLDFLLNQHRPSQTGDLVALLGSVDASWRDFHISHSDDKMFLLEECGAFLDESGIDAEHLDAILLTIDELLENGLYGAPQDGRGYPLYAKGEERPLADHERLALQVAVRDGLLGISVTDGWGTLLPAVFLNRLAHHVEGDGLIAGRGGAGFSLIWRLGDYLQLRVLPHRRTEITALFDLTQTIDPERDKGFQFLYHSEVHEASSHVFTYPAYSIG